MGKRTAAQKAAKTTADEINRTMRRRGYHASLVRTHRTREAGLEVWRAATDRGGGYPVELSHRTWKRDLDLGFTYDYLNDTVDQSKATLGLQSIALNCDVDEIRVCLVRYNREVLIKERGTHIHVWQPQPLNDLVHWRLPDHAIGGWDVDQVIAFMLDGNLAEELARTGF